MHYSSSEFVENEKNAEEAPLVPELYPGKDNLHQRNIATSFSFFFFVLASIL